MSTATNPIMSKITYPLHAHGGRVENQTLETPRPAPTVNVGEVERWASLTAGGALALYGVTRNSLGGWLLAGLGGCLAYRGLSGHCSGYAALGISTAEPRGANASIPAGHGIKVEHVVIIERPAAELYQFWRKLENLPKFMTHLESVRPTGATRSHWTAQVFGWELEWDAEIIKEETHSLIAWRSLEGADVDTAGSVHFEPATGGRGTQVRLVMKYDPPAGRSGAFLARLFGQAPEQQIKEDLRRFKQLMETGEICTVEGQTSCQGAK